MVHVTEIIKEEILKNLCESELEETVQNASAEQDDVDTMPIEVPEKLLGVTCKERLHRE